MFEHKKLTQNKKKLTKQNTKKFNPMLLIWIQGNGTASKTNKNLRNP